MKSAIDMSSGNRIFVAGWEYPPIMSGESVVCQKTLTHSRFDYDVCCGPIIGSSSKHIRLFPMEGNKYLIWPFQVLRKFRKLNKDQHYRIMMSRVMPPNGHLAGWLIKRFQPDIKWIVYFSDPIWNSPFLKFSFWKNADHRPNWLLMKIFGIPARCAIQQSDLLVFNNERLARYVLGGWYERYQDKVVIAPYGHEGVFLRPARKRGNEKVRLTHVGQIYGNRTFATLTEGVERLKEQEPELFEKLEIRQVGFVCESEKERIRRSPASSAFTLIGQVSYQQSLEEMYDADYLLIIDPVFDDSKKNIYVPGKIYDYMSTGRPILCIADEDSATGDIGKKTGDAIRFAKQDTIYEQLKACVTDTPVTIGEHYAQFHCQRGVDQLDRRIELLMM